MTITAQDCARAIPSAGLTYAGNEVAGKAAEAINCIGLELVVLPPGEFLMGGERPAAELAERFAEYGYPPEYFCDEYPQHRVRITAAFLLGKYPVTRGQWRVFAVESGYKTEAERDGQGGWGYDPAADRCVGRDVKFNWMNTGFPQTDRHPVVNVSWNDAVAFCRWLSEKEGRRYRLPTEAQWEYACRAGTQTLYAMGDDPADLTANSRTLAPSRAEIHKHVHQFPISLAGSLAFTCPVGQFRANGFGLYDMHGNVWEWAADWHTDDYYSCSPPDDPPGPPLSDVRVRRGGGWNSFPLWARASFRNWSSEDSRCLNLGFRVAAEISDPAL